VSPRAHFHTTDLRDFFHIIGSADRDLLKQIGVTFGEEFRALTDEEELGYEQEEDLDDGDWDVEEVEADAGREIVTKMIMSGLPQDLAEEEAYAVQDFLAAYVLRSDLTQAVDADDMTDDFDVDECSEVVESLRQMILQGVDLNLFGDFVNWLEDRGASHDLVLRVQMLQFGRLPESDEPTFSDLEEDVFAPRFAFLYSEEAAGILDELDELARRRRTIWAPCPFLSTISSITATRTRWIC